MNLQKLRKKLGIKQKIVAEKLHVRQSTVCMWETGKSRPPLKKIPALATALGVTEAEIIECFKEGKEK